MDDTREELRRGMRKYMRKIYAVLRSRNYAVRYARIRGEPDAHARFGVSPDSVGCIDEDRSIIWIDYRADVIATIVHECLHIAEPDMPEEEVRLLENQVMDRLTPTQARTLHILMMDCFWIEPEEP